MKMPSTLSVALATLIGAVAMMGVRAWGQSDCTSAECAHRKRTGSSPNDRLGGAVAAAGFLNSGNKEEIVVGAAYSDRTGSNAGRSYVFQGDSLSSVFGLFGETKGDRFGQALAGRIDVNDDNRDDLIIGAPYNDDAGTNAGQVYVFSGKDKTLIWSRKGQNAGDRFGFAVANAGDVDNDGVDDVIVGAPCNDYQGSDAGRAYVYSGSDGALIYRLNGLAAGDKFGFAVAGVGDVDDDGNADLAVSSIGSDVNGPNGGHITIFSGADKSIIQDIDSQEYHEKFGWALAATRFVEQGSPYTMLISSSPLHDETGPPEAGGEDSGHIHLYVRRHDQPICDDLFCQIHIANGEHPGDWLGTSLAVGQCWGNSIPDVLAGAPGHDAAGNNAGAVHILSVDGVMQFCCTFIPIVHTIHGEAAGDRFGSAVALADVNGDGVEDVVVGAPYNDAGGEDAGRVYVFFQ